ncbi:MAG: small basic protein [Candidatus Omnitrophica bacterium]|nr:small basic protein [Candidatus Omnitrophota bacterium]
MSIHPSLDISEKGKKHKSVLRRSERLKMMLAKGQWREGDKVFGLPKVKIIKMKIKKEKQEKAATPTEATSTTPSPAAEKPAK